MNIKTIAGITSPKIDVEVMDTLLSKMDQKLLEHYEDLYLPMGQTTKQIKVNYQDTQRDLERIKLVGFGIFMILSASILLFIVTSFFCNTRLSFLFYLLGGGFILSSVAPKIISKKEAKVREYESYLLGFEAAAAGFDCPMGRIYETYTRETALDAMVTYTEQILRAEKTLDFIRLQEARYESDIGRAVNSLQTCRAQFNAAERKILEFGIKFDHTELFAEAQRRLSRENR